MKNISFLSILVFLLTLSSNGQNLSFKTKVKKPAGLEGPELNQVNIDAGKRSGYSDSKKNSLISVAPSLPSGSKGSEVNRIIKRDGVPVYIERKTDASKSASGSSPEERFKLFISETRNISGFDNNENSFKISDVFTDDLGITHIKAVQQYKGVDIYGSGSTFHADAARERFTGKFTHPGSEVSTIPKISSENAVRLVIQDTRKTTVYKDLTEEEKKILHYDAPESSLMIYDTGNQYFKLVWAITIRPNFIEEWKYFVDAANGTIIRKFNNTCSDGPVSASALDLNNIQRTISAYLEGSTYYLLDMSKSMYNTSSGEGVILTLDANNTSTSNLDYKYVTSTNNSWTQKAAISAHYNAEKTYDYFLNTFGRNSLNGQGGNIISLVNVSEEDGSSMQNAFWNGQAVFYGNGGSYFKPLAGGLDVAAHELGHGVVSNSANLEYYGQSGAMNESFADIFGSMVDRDDWLIGEDITKTTFSPSGALRNMADPHNMGSSANSYWQPANLSEMYLGSEDNSGVHVNSGIVNYAYYLYATAVTKTKAEQVYYRALKNYLTSTSQFIDLRIAVVQSAADLYGSGSNEVVKAGESFDKVGIYEEQKIDKTQDYTINPGQEYLLSYDTDNSDPATLYRSSVTGTDFLAISNTAMKSRVSVTDDGSVAVFVSDDSRIRYVNLVSRQETILSNQTVWDNVAISKDGKRLAAISTSADTSIYVYDFASKKWAKFRLYNPTTSHFDTNAGGVLYADAIEFDVTGENLIYDACNVLSSSTLEDIFYWDIGFINVWNLAGNAFGNGNIQKLYGSLPENVSIGNPVFSKNSPTIIAFDYIDTKSNEYAILGADLSTANTDMITSNATLGYPSFSKDDKKIAYSALTTVNVEVVATIGLAANKISASGNATPLINNAKWPVYYATGSRVLGQAPISDFTADFRTGSKPLVVKFIDLSANEPVSWQWTFEGGSPSTSTLKNPEITFNNNGTFKVILTATNGFGNNTITKEAYIKVTDATGIEDTRVKDVWFYPNPAGDVLNIDCDYEFSVCLHDLNGNIILKSDNQRQIDISGLKKGLYILEIQAGNTSAKSKLIKR